MLYIVIYYLYQDTNRERRGNHLRGFIEMVGTLK
jgi:cbb3-type cytochrome oxidase subunit 3